MAYQGGSAYGMANSIMEGYILVSPVNLKKLTVSELKEVMVELDKMLKSMRGETVDLEDQERIQTRNRKMLKINQAMVVLNNFLAMRIKGRI